MEKKFGLPVANSDNIFDILTSLGIVKWKMTEKPIATSDYLRLELNDLERSRLKYMHKAEVVTFIDPDGKTFRGFRAIGGNGSVVFTILPGNLVVVCGEFMHGCEEVMLDLPGGMIEPEDEDPSVRAKKEFEEESGIVLEKVIPMSPRGTTLFARRVVSRTYSFLGLPSEPVLTNEQNLDDTEYLGVVLVPLDEWLKLIDMERVDGKSVVTTFKALRRLGLIKSPG
jgi:ADP-ribose pyrophosphatase